MKILLVGILFALMWFWAAGFWGGLLMITLSLVALPVAQLIDS